MKQHTVTTYEFEELSPESREHAIEKLWDINVAGKDWWQWTFEDAKNVGLKIKEFDLSYHYCRGDFIESATYTANKIIQEHGATCETYQTAQGFLAELDRFMETAEKDEYGELYLLRDEQKVEDIELGFLQAILEDYRILLQQEYDYQTSEEAIIETIRVNEYEFTENDEAFRSQRLRKVIFAR